jgi:alanyl-tRNA synthetase
VVLENDEVTTRLMAVDDAREAGARALFGEKYADDVRVVSMGKQSRDHGQNALGWSVELCGGTHVRRTGDIGLISVTGESAVSSGVRRIEALTGRHARKHANDTMAMAKTAASELRTTVDDMPARIAALMEERKKLERDLSEARRKLAMGGGGNGAQAAGGVREVGNVVDGARSRASRPRISRAWSTTARSRSIRGVAIMSPRTARPASWSVTRISLAL